MPSNSLDAYCSIHHISPSQVRLLNNVIKTLCQTQEIYLSIFCSELKKKRFLGVRYTLMGAWMIGLIPTFEMFKATFYSTMVSEPRAHVETLSQVLRLYEEGKCLIHFGDSLPEMLGEEMKALPESHPDRYQYSKLLEIHKTTKSNEIVQR